MKLNLRNLILFAPFISFSLIVPSQAANIVDVHLDDLNSITGQNLQNNTLFVTEDYNEDNTVPYPSPDGFAVVDNDPGEPVRWFDKILTIAPGDFDPLGNFRLQFDITNTSPYFWSDYHYEFYDANFTQKVPVSPQGSGQIVRPFASFEGTMSMDNALWWVNTLITPPTTDSGVSPGNTWTNWIDFNNATLANAGVCQAGGPCQFGIRQIATTHVPEPSSILSILSLGILGAGSTLKRKLKSSKSTEKETTKVG